MPDVQCFQIVVERKTSVPVYGPIWEKPLLQAKWRSVGIDANKIVTRRIDPSNPYVGSLSRHQFKDVESEVSRLRSLYDANPSTGGPLFDLVYPGATLFDVIEAELRRDAKTRSGWENEAEEDDNDVPEHLRLENLFSRGGDAESVSALKLAKIRSIDELASKRPSELEPIHGIGLKSGARLISKATSYLAKHDILPGMHAPASGDDLSGEPATPLQAKEKEDRKAGLRPDSDLELDAEGNDVLEDFDDDE